MVGLGEMDRTERHRNEMSENVRSIKTLFNLQHYYFYYLVQVFLFKTKYKSEFTPFEKLSFGLIRGRC